MAPGIFPAATSALMKSSICNSFSTASFAPGVGPSWVAAAGKAAADSTAAIVVANNVTHLRQDIDPCPIRLDRHYGIGAYQSRSPAASPAYECDGMMHSIMEDSHEAPHELLPGGPRDH